MAFIFLFKSQLTVLKNYRSLNVRLEKTVTKMVTGCLGTMKSCHVCIRWLKSISSLLWKRWDSVYVCISYFLKLSSVKNLNFVEFWGFCNTCSLTKSFEAILGSILIYFLLKQVKKYIFGRWYPKNKIYSNAFFFFFLFKLFLLRLKGKS